VLDPDDNWVRLESSSSVERFRQWMVGQALPYWAERGFDEAENSFIERVDFSGSALASVPRRTMVQARQIYVFSHAALLDWWPEGSRIALLAARNLIDRYFEADGQSGWVFSLNPATSSCNPKRDFYAYAFVLFGLAWAYKLEPDPRFLSSALKTLDLLDKQFASSSGGFHSELPPPADERRQNPHMHYFEAMIVWHEATFDSRFLARAAEIYGMMACRFFKPDTGTLGEYFDGKWEPKSGVAGTICEPGHHYEWSWLLRRYACCVGRGMDPIAERLFAHANRFGIDAGGLVVDELLDDGTVHRGSRRCWPQTEAIKACCAAFEAGDTNARSRAEALIERLLDTFVGRPIPSGWVDHIDERGAPIVSFIPASTLYHLFLACAEADRVWGSLGDRN
jgi:mannose/cellobiose epimerase-like protein (N-acyl-D-glucosamine 2-epimerase family)